MKENFLNLRDKFKPKHHERKTFRHDLLDVIELKDEIIDGRRYYTVPSGLKYPSVTTCLGELSKPHIDVWKERVGEIEAAKVLHQAGHRGTSLHNIAEKYMRNAQDYADNIMPTHAHLFAQITHILDNHIDDIKGIEYPLWSDKLRTAGRTDLIAKWDNNLAIIDFKTSRYPKEKDKIKHYFMQATCYSMMLKERINIDAKDIVVVMMVDHQEPIIFHEKTKNYLHETLKYFKNYNDPSKQKDLSVASLCQI